jgi:hypothetical protein
VTATLVAPPSTAAWQHRQARQGFEVVFLHTSDCGHRIEGTTAAVEDGQAWAVEYVITLDRDWLTKSALVYGRSASGRRELMLEADGAGAWTVNGAPAPEVDGCLDVDLEASSLTNAFPVHRLGLRVGRRPARQRPMFARWTSASSGSISNTPDSRMTPVASAITTPRPHSGSGPSGR